MGLACNTQHLCLFPVVVRYTGNVTKRFKRFYGISAKLLTDIRKENPCKNNAAECIMLFYPAASPIQWGKKLLEFLGDCFKLGRVTQYVSDITSDKDNALGLPTRHHFNRSIGLLTKCRRLMSGELILAFSHMFTWSLMFSSYNALTWKHRLDAKDRLSFVSHDIFWASRLQWRSATLKKKKLPLIDLISSAEELQSSLLENANPLVVSKMRHGFDVVLWMH